MVVRVYDEVYRQSTFCRRFSRPLHAWWVCCLHTIGLCVQLKEERVRRQVEQERANLERQLEMVDEEPVDGELALLTQTVAYVQKIIDEHKQTQSEENQASEKRAPEAVSLCTFLLPPLILLLAPCCWPSPYART